MTTRNIFLIAAFFIFSFVLYFVFQGLSRNEIVIGYNKGYQPTQPLPFSHQLHAGTHKIACNYCHTSVQISRTASVPSLNICMNCHLMIKAESPSIQKLTEHYLSDTPIEWQKVHLLPDHVKFNHFEHIHELEGDNPKKMNTSCKECHGPVEQMSVLYQWASFSMGWCIDCHKKPEHQAPIDCNTCHY